MNHVHIVNRERNNKQLHRRRKVFTYTSKKNKTLPIYVVPYEVVDTIEIVIETEYVIVQGTEDQEKLEQVEKSTV